MPCALVVQFLTAVFQYHFTEDSSVVSSSEDRSHLARIFNMSNVAVQTVKTVRILPVQCDLADLGLHSTSIYLIAVLFFFKQNLVIIVIVKVLCIVKML